LRLTAPRDFGALVLPQVLAEFSRRYREISFDLHITNAVVDLVGEGFDVGLRAAGKMKDSTLTMRRLASTQIELCAAPSYLARRGVPKRIGAEGHDWVLHPALIKGLAVPNAAIRFVTDDLILARDLIRDGIGVGLLPGFLASTYIRDGLLESLPITQRMPAGNHFYFVYPSSGQVPRKVIAFRDFLIAWLKKSPLE
jgi:DNA-binding transcriptional LysR family regulator